MKSKVKVNPKRNERRGVGNEPFTDGEEDFMRQIRLMFGGMTRAEAEATVMKAREYQAGLGQGNIQYPKRNPKRKRLPRARAGVPSKALKRLRTHKQIERRARVRQPEKNPAQRGGPNLKGPRIDVQLHLPSGWSSAGFFPDSPAGRTQAQSYGKRLRSLVSVPIRAVLL
jgi:hypothetical protein